MYYCSYVDLSFAKMLFVMEMDILRYHCIYRSSMGTMILIYFTLAINRRGGWWPSFVRWISCAQLVWRLGGYATQQMQQSFSLSNRLALCARSLRAKSIILYRWNECKKVKWMMVSVASTDFDFVRVGVEMKRCYFVVATETVRMVTDCFWSVCKSKIEAPLIFVEVTKFLFSFLRVRT